MHTTGKMIPRFPIYTNVNTNMNLLSYFQSEGTDKKSNILLLVYDQHCHELERHANETRNNTSTQPLLTIQIHTKNLQVILMGLQGFSWLKKGPLGVTTHDSKHDQATI